MSRHYLKLPEKHFLMSPTCTMSHGAPDKQYLTISDKQKEGYFLTTVQ